MQTICQLGVANLWTGKSRTLADTDGCPPGWVLADAPAPVSGETAQWFAGQWISVPEGVRDAAALAPARAAASVAAVAAFNQRVAAGYPALGLHVAIDAEGRTDLGAMARTAMAAIGGVAGIAWPPCYAAWFTLDGPPIALPTPEAGLALATGAETYYSLCVAHAAGLRAQLAAAVDLPALAAIDIAGGWPLAPLPMRSA